MLKNFRLAASLVMFEEDFARPSQNGGTTPLFYRKRMQANGESCEVSFGPSAVSIFRWTAAVILVLGLIILGNADPLLMVKILFKLLQ